MKQIKRFSPTLLTSLLLTIFMGFLEPAAYTLSAQGSTYVRITISKKKKTVDGKTYYLHTVRKGENLFAIASAYGVLQKDIVAANPNAFSGIRIGEELLIPADSGTRSYLGEGIEAARYIYHISKAGQQKEDVAQQYGIALDTLYKYNPELQYAPLDAGQVIIIPKAIQEVVTHTEEIPDGYIIHKVAARETLYAISRQYGITKEEILQANPDIDRNTERIRAGQDLRIPSDSHPISLPLVYKQTDTIIVRKDTLSASQPVRLSTPTPMLSSDSRIETLNAHESRTLHVALLAPFFLDENTFLQKTRNDQTTAATDVTAETQASKPELYDRSLNFLEFYQGFLTAMSDLKQHGYQIELHTFDTGRSTEKLNDMLQRPELRQSDLVVGPFYSEMLTRMQEFSAATGISFVSPLTENTGLLADNPYMLQFFPDKSAAWSTMLDYLRKQQDASIIIVRNTSEALTPEAMEFIQGIQQQCPVTQIVPMTADQKEVFGEGFFAEDRRYICATTSTDEVFAANLMAQLNVALQDYHIELCGPAAWADYVNIDLEYFHALEFRCCAPFFIDRSREETRQFLNSYYNLFQTEPYGMLSKGYNYAFLGYDMGIYFVKLIQKHGRAIGPYLMYENARLLQSNVAFTRQSPFSGFANTAFRLVHYTTDFRLVEESVTSSAEQPAAEKRAEFTTPSFRSFGKTASRVIY